MTTIWKDPKPDMITKINRYREELNSSTKASSFSDFISDILKNREMTREDLAIALGYQEGEESRKKAQTLKHTIGRVGYTTNRDRIIAICLALEMSHPDTDRALYLYGMLPLSEYDLRDILLIQALTEHIGFSETNRLLEKAGLPSLEIEKTKQLPGPHVIREPKDDYVLVSGPTYLYGNFAGDKSLSGLYNPASYSFDGEMTLQDSNGIIYKIGTSDGGTYTVQIEKTDGSFISMDMYPTLSECMGDRFREYFLELEDGIRRKVKDVLFTMDDTRNYIMRFDADVQHGNLILYAETFNYDCPEHSEYYQMEMINGNYRMTVTPESRYMRRHLGNIYSQYYRHHNNTDIFAAYTSVEEIRNSNKTSRAGSFWKKEREKHFLKLQEALTGLISELKNKTILVNDPDSCFDDIYYDLAGFYKVRNLFTWERMEEDFYMMPIEDSCIATTSDGSDVSVTLDEMKRAFELGITSIDDIYLVKNMYGEIDGILR